MMDYRTLENVSYEEMHSAFIGAFSDYLVKMDMPIERYKAKLQMDGFEPKVSMGAFNDGVLVGFILNGFRYWQGKMTVYDGGTGVIPEYRKQGITTAMFEEACKILREKKVRQYLLEVIQENTPALNLYKNQGFRILRELMCYREEKAKLKIKASNPCKVKLVYDISTLDWEVLQKLWDYHPTWQNSIDSVAAAAGDFAAVISKENESVTGYGIINRKSGAIPQLAVKAGYREKGIGSRILVELIKLTEGEKVSLINIDSASKSTCDFLEKVGFVLFAKQYEMSLEL